MRDTMTDAAFRRAFAIVLCRYGKTFEALAEYDKGDGLCYASEARRQR